MQMKISLSFRRVAEQTRKAMARESASSDLCQSSSQQERAMDQRLLLVLMSGAVCCVSGALNPSKLLYFVDQPKSFAEAQRYCRDNFVDLVTLRGREETEELLALGNRTASAWIGLRKTGQMQWRWALADPELYREGEAEYRNWGPGEPTNTTGEYCSVMDSDGRIRDTTCVKSRTFVCYNGQNYNEPKYILIDQLKAWRDAQSYCREFHTDLVSVRNPDENLQIQRLIPAGQVTYIGLFQDPFVWSDGGTSSFRNWDLFQPDGSGECVVQQLQNRRRWDDQPCDHLRAFFCYAIPMKVKQVLRLTVESDQNVNVNDPDVKAAILEEIQQRLISQGLSEQANLRWRQQINRDVFQRTEENALRALPQP